MNATEITRSFARNLRDRRKALGLSQKELGDLLGYSSKAVSKWESGESTAPTVLLPELSKILKISIDALLKVNSCPDYYLGIDGGGTKTEFVLVDSNGHLQSRLVLGGCNPNDIGMPAALAVLQEGLDAICQNIPPEKISLFAGIAGGQTGDNRQIIYDFLSGYRFAAFDCGNDARNAVASTLGDRDGLTLIVGTGYVTFVQKNKELTKIGGFNYLFEEAGSGYSLGRDAIYYALRHEEQKLPTSPLYEMVKEKCGTETVQASVAEFYIGGKRLIASYAPLVFDACAAGDTVAAEILQKNVRFLSAQIREGLALLDQKDAEVVLVGGLTHREELLQMLQSQLKGCNISTYQGSLCKGALRLAGLEEIKC